MNILVFTENYYRGGLDTFIVTLLNNWPCPEDQFTLVCNGTHPGLPDIRERLSRPCRIISHELPTYAALVNRSQNRQLLNMVRRCIKPLVQYVYLWNAVYRLRSLLCDGSFDRLLVVNGGYPGGDTCRAAGIAWGLYSGRPASIHNFHNLATPPKCIVRWQENHVDGLLARHTKNFVTVSQAAADSMALRPAIPAEKVAYIHNGLETSLYNADTVNLRSELGLDSDTPLCLMLGTYEPRKGHEFLLRVFQRVVTQVPKARFVSCGHGSLEEVAAVASIVRELGLESRVHLLGFRSDAMALLAQADLLLVGSQKFESFGLTCVEAMARRVPVVATRVGGLPEVVADGDGGYTFDCDDVEGYTQQVTLLLNDQVLRAEQGNKGIARFERLFAAQRMAKEYAQLIRP